jgi:predicted nucleotidyltransferase component of viral defense system
VIKTSELHRIAALEGIRFDQTEKDYVILWILYGLSQPDFNPAGWAFKGGTCLRHCYYPGYRFSEDLDFSCESRGEALGDSLELVARIATWIQISSGISMRMKVHQSIPGDFQVEIPMEYNRGGLRRQNLPYVKIHLTFDEPISTKVVARSVKTRYSDLSDFEIKAYSKEEILAEKMRALLQQQKKWPRPRDLYDLWFILCQSGEQFQGKELKKIFNQKCGTRKIEPDMASLISENLREWNRDAWVNQIGPLMKDVPEFDRVWSDWITTFYRIFGENSSM